MGPEFKVDPRVQGSRYELLVYFDLVQICFLVLFIKTKSFLWAIVRFSQRMCSKLCFTTTILFHLVSFTLTLGSYSWEECVILIFFFLFHPDLHKPDVGVLCSWRVSCLHEKQNPTGLAVFPKWPGRAFLHCFPIFFKCLHWNAVQMKASFTSFRDLCPFSKPES